MLNQKLALLILLFIPSFAQAIINGVPVQKNDPVGQVTVAIEGISNSAERHFFTGTIIANDLILTAAHAVSPSEPHKIIFSLDPRDPKAPSVMAQAYAFPAEWNGCYTPEHLPCANRHDVALLYFKGGLPVGYHKANFFTAKSSATTGYSLAAAGYGIFQREPAQSDVLRRGDFPMNSRSYSETELQVPESPALGMAIGDSGAPLFVISQENYFLVGVCNWGKDAQYTIYTKINSYLGWIAATAEKFRHVQ